MTFETWRSLVREQGLAPVEAVDLMAALVALAARDPDVVARVSC
jgi:hypothetical protein